jgi:hypothetical protein
MAAGVVVHGDRRPGGRHRRFLRRRLGVVDDHRRHGAAG